MPSNCWVFCCLCATNTWSSPEKSLIHQVFKVAAFTVRCVLDHAKHHKRSLPHDPVYIFHKSVITPNHYLIQLLLSQQVLVQCYHTKFVWTIVWEPFWSTLCMLAQVLAAKFLGHQEHRINFKSTTTWRSIITFPGTCGAGVCDI